MTRLALVLVIAACGSDDSNAPVTSIDCDAPTTIVADSCTVRTAGGLENPLTGGIITKRVNSCTGSGNGFMTCAESEIASDSRRGVVIVIRDQVCELRECE